MSATPKASRRPRGIYLSGQPGRPVMDKTSFAKEDRQVDRWWAKRHCDGHCGDERPSAWACSAVARRRRMRLLYARRSR